MLDGSWAFIAALVLSVWLPNLVVSGLFVKEQEVIGGHVTSDERRDITSETRFNGQRISDMLGLFRTEWKETLDTRRWGTAGPLDPASGSGQSVVTLPSVGAADRSRWLGPNGQP